MRSSTMPKAPKHHGGNEERWPVAQARILQQEPGHKGTHHILRPVREIDQVEQTKDHRQAEAEHGIEGAINQPEQELAQQGLRWNAKHMTCPLRQSQNRAVLQPGPKTLPAPGDTPPNWQLPRAALRGTALRLGEGALPLVEGTKCCCRRNRVNELVVVPGTLRVSRRLDLKEVHRVDLTPVGADRALAKEYIIGWQRLHFGDERFAIAIAVDLGQGLEIVQHGAIDPGVDHGGHFATVFLGKAPGPGACLIIEIPIESLGQLQPLGGLEAEGVHVRDEHEQPGQFLAPLDQAKLSGLFNGVDGVPTSIGQANNLRFGALGLQVGRMRSPGY